MATETIDDTLQHERVICVEEQIALPYLSPNFTGFSQTPPVFVAAFLVATIENACDELIKTRLGAEKSSVGAAIRLHIHAPIVVGAALRTTVSLTNIADNRVGFDFVCQDEVAVIAQGQHERELVG